MTMKKKYLKILKLLLKLSLSAVAFYIVFRKIRFDDFVQTISHANPWYFIIACMVFLFSKIISSFRFNEFYKTRQLLLEPKLNVQLYIAGMFYNLFVPLVGGEGYKAYWLFSKYKFPVKNSLWCFFLDRLSGLAALTFLGLVFFYFSSIVWEWKNLVFVALPVLYAGHFLFMKLFFSSYTAAFSATTAYSAAVQITQVLCVWFIMQSLGVSAQITDYIFIFLLSCYAYMVPFTGARELAFVMSAEVFHLDKETSLAISLLFYASMSLASLPGLFYVFFPEYLNEKSGRFAGAVSSAPETD